MENEITDGEILSGSPRSVRLGGVDYTLRTPPRRWAREFRAKFAGIGRRMEEASDEEARIKAMEDLFDCVATHPSLEEHRDAIEEDTTDEECARALAAVIEQVTAPLAATVGAMTTNLEEKTPTTATSKA